MQIAPPIREIGVSERRGAASLKGSYQLQRRFLLVVLPFLAIAMAALLLAFAQALSSSTEYAYKAQARSGTKRLYRLPPGPIRVFWAAMLPPGQP